MRLVEPAQAVAPLELIDRFCHERWTHRPTANRARYMLRRLISDSATTNVADLTTSTILHWCAGDGQLANNTVRARSNAVVAFLRWCSESGIDAPPADALTHRNSPLRQYRPTYGKVQSPYPARWLTRDEAYNSLLASVDSSTPVGLRDELVLRLGLMGVRAQEIGALIVGDVECLDGASPSLHWTGKGHKPRRVAIGARTASALRLYLDAYERAIGQRPQLTAPLICRAKQGRVRAGELRQVEYGSGWVQGATARANVWNIVTTAAKAAGLGHVAPHDLRRSAAGILHRDRSVDGGHTFDLLDIQKVLGHADPATTMKCYLDPMDTGVLDRAATVLD